MLTGLWSRRSNHYLASSQFSINTHLKCICGSTIYFPDTICKFALYDIPKSNSFFLSVIYKSADWSLVGTCHSFMCTEMCSVSSRHWLHVNLVEKSGKFLFLVVWHL
uniref:Uncharacterized protein n=1 Tax=Pyxicephalus adspersus TaxID=30357 RepID=A0AAV3AG05_PYXAD|nr:TPA: hypothetical protein GDO54_013188 [Pyxicephalus adspersus]